MGRYTLIFLLLLWTFPAWSSDKVAKIVATEGTVLLIREGHALKLSDKDWLFRDDRIITKQKSAIELRLVDGSYINLGEFADLYILDLVFDPVKKDGFIDLKLVKGAFRMISGTIAKLGPDLMTLDLPTATIGIRGTGLIGKASPVGVENFVILVPDPDGHIGELVVQNTEGIVILRKAKEGITMIYPDRKLAKKKYTKKFIQELIKQVPKIKYESLHDRQFKSLFLFN